MATKADKPGGIEELRRRVSDEPANPDLRLALADALHAERRFDEAVTELKSSLELDAANVAVWSALGRSQNNLGNLDDAEAAFRRATELEPDNATAWNYLGHVLRAHGQLEAARDTFSKALAIAPDLAGAHHNLATVYNELGELDLAEESFRRGLALRADDPQGWQNLGDLLHVRGRLADAESCYQRVLDVSPDNPDALAALATLAQGRNRHDQAQALFARVLEIETRHPVALAGMAWHLELQGDPERALALLERDKSSVSTPELLSIYARLLRRSDREDEAVVMLEPWYRKAINEEPVPIHLLFALGDAYDKQGRYDQAFGCYQLGNRRRRAKFDPTGHRAWIDSQIHVYTSDAMEATPVKRGDQGVQPVFIVGMPRSGTSLIEQILAAHPAVFACGERDWVHRLAKSLERGAGGYAASDPALDQDPLAGKADEYVSAAGTLPTGTRWLTDKLPANFLYLGLISRLFPDAHVIHCERDLMDSGLSCFKQNFKSNAMSFSHELTHIGVYAIEYQRLMAHWQSVLPLPVLTVPYHELVADQEVWTRKLVDFLELPWDARCLRFHELDRVVNTASYEQARRPVYRSSVGQWRNYEAQLQPLRDALKVRGQV